MIFVVHGVGVLMPWNMFINANDVRSSTLVDRLIQSRGSTGSRPSIYNTHSTALCSGLPG